MPEGKFNSTDRTPLSGDDPKVAISTAARGKQPLKGELNL